MSDDRRRRDAESVAPEILSHYNEFCEANRLTSGRGLLERDRTLDILQRVLPPPGAVVYDIGGAAGVYAIHLVREGYRVELFDPVARHIAQAREAATQAGATLQAAEVSDARNIPRTDRSADAVLLMGPLYHLQDRSQRIAALSESLRLLKPGGVIVATAISRFASMIDAGYAGVLDDRAFTQIVRDDIAAGRHNNPTSHPDLFTSSFFHRPEELEAEVNESGFADTRLIMIEGPFGVLPGGEERWREVSYRRTLLDFIRSVESEPTLMGASIHFLATASAP